MVSRRYRTTRTRTDCQVVLMTVQILQRASEDQEKLREIVRDLKIHCDQVRSVG